jgi:hypothetical protein
MPVLFADGASSWEPCADVAARRCARHQGGMTDGIVWVVLGCMMLLCALVANRLEQQSAPASDLGLLEQRISNVSSFWNLRAMASVCQCNCESCAEERATHVIYSGRRAHSSARAWLLRTLLRVHEQRDAIARGWAHANNIYVQACPANLQQLMY